MLGALMSFEQTTPALLDVVALLNERAGLPRGQVGTVVDFLNADTALVEFSDDDGRPYAVEPIDLLNLIVLHYEPQDA